MAVSYTYVLCLLFFGFKILASKSQYLPISRKTSKACDGTSNTALVEQFFNVIFNEFHNSPPICVCVQMCPDQPTYCYPNGCLKKVDYKRKVPEDRPAPVTSIRGASPANTMFLVDENNYSQMLNDNADSAKNVLTERPTTAKDMRPDPFKDRYKILFKSKKMPKVELRYNLREQVKNMKIGSDLLKVETKDVSKTRWPKGKQLFNDQQVYKANEKQHERRISESGISPGVNGAAPFTSKYFKRDLRRNEKDDIDVEVDSLTEIPDPLDNKNFSIETLIENLIGKNFEGKRDTDAGSDIYEDSKGNLSTEVTPSNDSIHSPYINKTTNESPCVMSMNMTNQNVEENKYLEDSAIVKERMDQWKNYTFNEMITALSKRIEKQNNTSMEIMRQATRNDIELVLENSTNVFKGDNLKTAESTSLHKNLTDEIQTVIITNKSENVNATRESHRKKTQIN